MKDTETRSKFIQLRAQGKSFASIAEELQVSKRTLLLWNRELVSEISNFKAVALEALYEEFHVSSMARIRILGEQLEKVLEELAKRDLGDVPTGTLLTSFLRLTESLKSEQVELEFAVPIPEDESESEKLVRELNLIKLG